MALSVKKGTFTFATSDSGTKSITGVGFTGKALLLWAGRATTDDTWTADAALHIGMATENDARCVSVRDQDAVGTAQVVGSQHVTQVLRGLDNAGALDFALTPAATLFNSNGFDLTVTDAPSSNVIVHYVVLGGSDITDAAIVDMLWPASAGFPYEKTVGFQPDIMFLASTAGNDGATSVDYLTAGSSYGISFGIAKSDTARVTAAYINDDGAAAMTTGTILDAHAFAQFRGSTTVSHERTVDLATKANWPVDGVEWVFVEGTGTQTGASAFALCLKGTFEVGAGRATSAVSASTTDIASGVTTPALTFIVSDDLPSHDGLDSSHADGHGISLGAYDGTTQGSVDIQQDDGNTNSVAKNISDADKIIRLTGPGATPANRGVGTVSYPSGGTVRLTWSGRDATARNIGWAVLGGAAGPTTHFGASTLTSTVSATTTARLTAKAATATAETVARTTAALVTAKSSATLTETVAITTAGTAESGADTHFGATSLTLTATATITATLTAKGATTTTETVSATTAGTRTRFGAAALTETVAVTTAATRTRFGTLSLTQTFGATTVGRVTAKGAVSRPEVVTITTTPELAGQKYGAASVTETVTATTTANATAKSAATTAVTVATATVGALDAHGAAALPLAITVGTAAQIGSYGSATLPIVVAITTNSGQQTDLTDVETGYISFGPHGQLLGPTTGRVVR